jgi:type VI secretion system protein ImpL
VTIKSLLFFLFLYVCLVWVAAAYWHSGRGLRDFGLFWTGVGLIVVLAFIIGARLFYWWRLWRAKAAIRPVAPPKPRQIIHEDDAALAALIGEANATLAKAPAYASDREGRPLSRLPLYLLIGPESSGKTSTFVNSGLDPQLLAGQVTGPSPIVPTRLCNLWLAKNAIFAEVFGRAFSGELGRWSQLLGVLRGKPSVPLWRRFWGESEQGWALRGVIGFCDVKEFTGASSDPQRLDRYCRDWQERLRVVGEVFGVDFPVYHVFTKCDAIPFFPDFFRRLPETEASQVLGCTLPFRKTDADRPTEVFAQAEAKRLTASFRPLYQALAEKRLTHLAHEPDPARRPAVYEFPRELKRIRSSLVQFLTDVFRPHPLRPGPVLRGYYLTAVREVEVAAPDLTGTGTGWPGRNVAMDGTRLFSGDATRVFRAGDVSSGPSAGGRGRLVPRWMFVSDLFHSVVLPDAPIQKVVPSDPRLELYRRALFAAVCGLCALLCIAFFWSWAGNRKLLHELENTAVVGTQKTGKLTSLDQLRSLEALRVQVARLREYERDGAPWSLRWGLYSGGKLLGTARGAYFRLFQQLLLNDLNSTLVSRLQTVPATPPPNAAYQPIYDALKTHLMISSCRCKAEPALVSRVLKETNAQAAQAGGSEWQALAETQIDFYAGELPYGNPLDLREDPEARDRARQYLKQIKGVERIYAGILAKAAKTLTTPQRLADVAPNYAQVLKGPGELSAVFTPDGWKFVEKASEESNAAALGEPCVIGQPSGFVAEQKQEAAVAQAIRRMFVRDYVDRWRGFVAGFSVARYAGPADAARKLGVLADHNSPLLALFAMTADKTTFSETAGEQGVLQTAKKVPLVGKVLEGFEGARKTAGTVTGTQPGQPDPFSSPAYITQVFQPVQWVVPPHSETWVVDKNKAYIESLAELSHSMQDIARGTDNPDPAVHQAASQNYEKALGAVRQIAEGFKPAGDEGLDRTVEQLLEEPILFTQGYIVVDPGKAVGARVNGQLRALCEGLRNTLHKYPFQQSSPQDTSLEELTRWFGPASGGLWKFQAQSLPELTVKDGSQWKVKDPAKKPQVTQEILSFLNRAQAVTDAFYPPGAAQPQLTYTLRPKLDSSFKDSILELEIDGHPYQWTSSLQKQFSWPAPADAKTLGAIARIRTGSVAFAFASRLGPWGIFRIMGDAEPRALSSKLVEWKYTRGVDGRAELIQPAPVRLEIVESSGGVDVFNPKFLGGLQCPGRAVE